MTRLRLLAAVALGLVAAAAPARASFVVYDNGPLDASNGNEMTQWIQAENFTLGAAQTLVGVEFYSGEFTPGYLGAITWQIYANAAGTPGSLLASGTTAAVTRTSVAPGIFTTAYRNEFSIGSVALAAGDYWLGLHNGPLGTDSRSEMYWATSATGNGPTGREDVTPFGTGGFVSNGQEHAFRLFAADVSPVPAPPAVALALMGLASAGGLARLRRRVAA
jgi:hypothetical protein